MLPYSNYAQFSALRLKDEVQAEVQEQLCGLSPEEMMRWLREDVETGPFADWWRRVREAEGKEATRDSGPEPETSAVIETTR